MDPENGAIQSASSGEFELVVPLPWPRIRSATRTQPLRVIFSACLLGSRTGWEGDSYDEDLALKLAALPNVSSQSFCPEHAVLGTPRLFTTIHGGDGRAVLRGQATIKMSDGVDVTERMLVGANQMLKSALGCNADLAVMLEISDSCGSHALYLGDPRHRQYQQGVGLSAALLLKHGIAVVGSRDARTLHTIIAALDPNHQPDPEAIDYVEQDWYREYFASGRVGVPLGEADETDATSPTTKP